MIRGSGNIISSGNDEGSNIVEGQGNIIDGKGNNVVGTGNFVAPLSNK